MNCRILLLVKATSSILTEFAVDAFRTVVSSLVELSKYFRYQVARWGFLSPYFCSQLAVLVGLNDFNTPTFSIVRAVLSTHSCSASTIVYTMDWKANAFIQHTFVIFACHGLQMSSGNFVTCDLKYNYSGSWIKRCRLTPRVTTWAAAGEFLAPTNLSVSRRIRPLSCQGNSQTKFRTKCYSCPLHGTRLLPE